MTSRRHLRPFIALLLPLLALRALLPPGYMPLAGADGPRIVMCGTGLSTTLSTAAGDHPHHRLPASGNDCPFAHAAVHAPPPQLATLGSVAFPQIRFIGVSVEGLPFAAGPPRIASARAPPLLSPTTAFA